MSSTYGYEHRRRWHLRQRFRLFAKSCRLCDKLHCLCCVFECIADYGTLGGYREIPYNGSLGYRSCYCVGPRAKRRVGHQQVWLQTLFRKRIFCPESLLSMSGRADGAAPGEPSSQPKRAGRPPGKRCNYVTQDAEGRVIKRALSPFRAQASASKRSCIADQQDSLIDPTRAAQVSSSP